MKEIKVPKKQITNIKQRAQEGIERIEKLRKKINKEEEAD